MGRESSIILEGTWSFRYQSSLFWDKSWQPSMWGWASFASEETSQVVQSYLKSLASFFKSPYAKTHDFWAEGQHTSRGGGQGASLFWHKGKWLWQQLGGSRRNSRDPPLPQLKYCSHNSSNCRFIWAKNVLLLKFKYSPEGIRLTLKCKIPQHYLCWVAEALGPLSSWNGPRDAGKEAAASLLPLALGLLRCWWALASTLIPERGWNFHSSGTSGKRKCWQLLSYLFVLATWCKNTDFVITKLCSNLSLIARKVTYLHLSNEKKGVTPNVLWDLLR